MECKKHVSARAASKGVVVRMTFVFKGKQLMTILWAMYMQLHVLARNATEDVSARTAFIAVRKECINRCVRMERN
jgi:hypothetical protein